MEIIWQEPPTPARINGSRIAFVDELKKNPGQWALFRSATYASTGYGIRKMYKHNLEIRCVKVSNSAKGTPQYDIYLRWMKNIFEVVSTSEEQNNA